MHIHVIDKIHGYTQKDYMLWSVYSKLMFRERMIKLKNKQLLSFTRCLAT